MMPSTAIGKRPQRGRRVRFRLRAGPQSSGERGRDSDVVATNWTEGARAGRGERLGGVAAAAAGPVDLLPRTHEDYATKIARDWNVKASGVGYATRFEVQESFMDRCEVRRAGDESILEYWIPAEDRSELNTDIVGKIEVVVLEPDRTYRPPNQA